MRASVLVSLVRRLLTLEAAEGQDQDSVIGAAERVSDKLRAHLSKRIGQEGFQVLLARALTLATARFPHLSAVRVDADGSLIGLRRAADVGSQRTSDSITQQDAVEGVVALVAELLGLLMTFIGEDLTLRLLSTVSPGLAIPELDSDDAAGRMRNDERTKQGR